MRKILQAIAHTLKVLCLIVYFANHHITVFFVIYINPLSAKLFNLNFHPLEVVSRWRDPQLQVSQNY